MSRSARSPASERGANRPRPRSPTSRSSSRRFIASSARCSSRCRIGTTRAEVEACARSVVEPARQQLDATLRSHASRLASATETAETAAMDARRAFALVVPLSDAAAARAGTEGEEAAMRRLERRLDDTPLRSRPRGRRENGRPGPRRRSARSRPSATHRASASARRAGDARRVRARRRGRATDGRGARRPRGDGRLRDGAYRGERGRGVGALSELKRLDQRLAAVDARLESTLASVAAVKSASAAAQGDATRAIEAAQAASSQRAIPVTASSRRRSARPRPSGRDRSPPRARPRRQPPPRSGASSKR